MTSEGSERDLDVNLQSTMILNVSAKEDRWQRPPASKGLNRRMHWPGGRI
jgi:hypothetical protein